jgi:hypothetical protein
MGSNPILLFLIIFFVLTFFSFPFLGMVKRRVSARIQNSKKSLVPLHKVAKNLLLIKHDFERIKEYHKWVVKRKQENKPSDLYMFYAIKHENLTQVEFDQLDSTDKHVIFMTDCSFHLQNIIISMPHGAKNNMYRNKKKRLIIQ